MTPQHALRMLESILESTDITHDKAVEAEEALSVLWYFVLLGDK
jgi:hypothetical protein